MTNLLGMIRSSAGRQGQRDSFPSMSFDQWLEMLNFGGNAYGVAGSSSLAQPRQEAPSDFRGVIEQAYMANGVVFACMLVRMQLFSEARFQWRQMVQGRPGDLFGSPELLPLEKPWRNGTTGDLLLRMIRDADLEGNFFAAREPDPTVASGVRLQHLRPDWVTIVMGSRTLVQGQPSDHPNWERDAEVAGYLYHPGGKGSGRDPEVLLPENVCHFAPIPDPTARYRGMSWLTPLAREIMGDSAAMSHKLKYFENGATANLVVSLDPAVTAENFQKWVDVFEDEHAGMSNAYRTLYFGGGADAKVIGSDMRQVDFKVTQGHGETRIAAASGVPPVIVGLSEGLDAATYSNYAQARRRLADGTMRPLWRNAAASLERILDKPQGRPGVALWYDDRDIPFLQEDVAEKIDILKTEADTTRTLIEAGFQPDDVVKAVQAGDLMRLVGKHTGLFSVQLQEPGSKLLPESTPGGGADGKPNAVPAVNPATEAKPSTNGNGKGVPVGGS